MARIQTSFGKMNIYDEANASVLQRAVSTSGFASGYSGRDYGQHPFGSMPWQTFPLQTIPRREWSDRIKECNAKKMFALHHHKARKVPILNQARTNYCWMNCVVGALMNCRARVGLPTLNLSSASAAAPGKRYQNVGGWTGEALGYISEYGLATHASWPNAEINRKYFSETRGEAEHFNAGQWFELDAKKFDQIATCLLMGWEVVVGLMWWGHAVYYNALVEIGNGLFGVVCVNSWDDTWENGGMTVLAEDKANADEANCIVTVRLDGWQHDLKRIADWSQALAV